MNLTSIAFANRKLVFLLLALVSFYGVISYGTLPAREDPQITIREAIVTTRFPGLNPQRVEDLITKKLERAIRQIPEVEEIRSTSSTGESLIHVVIEDQYTDLDRIWQDLRNKVQGAQSELPEGTGRSKVNDEFGDVSVITLALTGESYTYAALNDMAKHVRDHLYLVTGTKKIQILGMQEERIFLEVSNAKLAQFGFNPFQLSEILASQNIIQPGGRVDTGARSFIIEPTGNFNTFDEVTNTLIALPESDDVVELGDLVDVKRGYIDPPHQPSYFNGERAIFFTISMLDGHNVLEFSPRMLAEIERVEQTLPVGMTLNIATYQADQVASTVYGVSASVLQTLVIVLAVVILFLGLRTGLVVGTIVPFVMLATLAIMNFTGMELERMSLATLIISLGLLVDNGIVIAEDFRRRVDSGADRYDAIIEGCRELAIPLLVSSLTTILVFLPLMLAQHVAGEYTRSISLVILISLSVSWFLALCVTPVFCYYFISFGPQPDSGKALMPTASLIGHMKAPYGVFLDWILARRLVFLAGMLALFIGSILLMRFVPQQFFPDSDRTQLLIYVEFSSSTTSRTTDRRMKEVYARLGDKELFPAIESFSGFVGYGGPRFVLSLSPEDPSQNTGFIVINVEDVEFVDTLLSELRTDLNDTFPDIRARVTKMFLGPSDSSKLEIQVKGPDADVLIAAAEQIEGVFRSIEGTIDIRHDWENRITNVLVAVDQQQARRAGITSRDIARSMNGGFSGTPVTDFRDGDDVIPIILRADGGERFNLDRVRSMNVYSEARGTTVPLFQIASFAPITQFAKIQREDMFRTVTIEAKSLVMTAEDMKAVIDDKVQEISATLPLNHELEYDGVIKMSGEAQEALSASVPMMIGLIIIILVGQFRSFRKAGIIVLTIPLIMVGAVVGLLATGAPFGFMVTLGIYSLAGIIINNAIVLIERFQLEEDAGKPRHTAIVDACLVRLRPIVMTTITTVLGLMPLIISHDPLFFGMANAMAFGLAVGTILTLGVVPVLYSLFYPEREVPPETGG